jgi:hypothetical protein
MRFFAIVLPVVALALPGSVRAQGQPPAGAPRSGVPDAPKANSRAMYEDIEVMRLVLARNLHVKMFAQCNTCHAVANERYTEITGLTPSTIGLGSSSSGGGMGVAMVDIDSDGRPDLFITNVHEKNGPTASIEGAYLKGQGVVFTLSLPAAAKDELAATAPAAPARPPSEWEQSRRQLRGERATTTAPPKKTTVADILLKTLAENGKNFTQLPANEQLTLIVTFRRQQDRYISLGGGIFGVIDPYANMTSGPTGMGGKGGGGPGMGPAGATGSASGPPMGAGSSPTGGSGAGSSAASEPMTPDRELELLGDLHIKRGNLSEAASAYERAKKQAADRQRFQALVTKLADVYLKLNNIDAARKALEMPSATPTAAPPPVAAKEPAAMNLPGKLILSAPKSLLDQVGGEMISFADFRKQVTLEVQTFDAAKGK